ncbi:hypothetical protein ABZU32_39685 [Sphaerisporangium sp. NPDC005288]|uniref:hypothetical protein n=1 Tax=Sphaerisporangium sp. NPDC005288 TaxID=3155114 RepID=UPI00339DF707
MTDATNKSAPAWAARLRAERRSRCWTQRQMAKAIFDAADDETRTQLPGRDSLIRNIKEWEAGRHRPKDPYPVLYCRVFAIEEADLFSNEESEIPALDPLVNAVKETRQLPISSVVPYAELSRALPGRRDADMAAMQAFRTADLQVGGGHLYASVIAYLQADVAPRLFGSVDENSDTVFKAATAFTEMAGWMAHDSGRDLLAEQHFERALVLTKAGSDRHLTAHILSSMSHLASHLNNPDKAIRLARKGQNVLRLAPRSPTLTARLLAMEARGFARLGHAIECVQLLKQAERALESSCLEGSSQWISNFDEGSLASESARCMSQLGKLAETRHHAARVVSLRPTHRTRSRAFGQLSFASALIGLGRAEEACTVAQEVLASTQSLGSFLIIKQLRTLQHDLISNRAATGRIVSEFIAHLEAVLEERLWLYQWLTKGNEPSR